MIMYKLVLLRHGESQWNLDNRFTGWTDVDLTKKGETEAYKAGRLIKENNISFDTVHTSVLKRANRTMEICLDAMGIKNTEINYDWRLNERHYGALQGLNKSETALKYGDDQVLIWRRSYSTPPPKLDSNDERHPKFDSLYKNLDKNDLPDSECLADTVDRFLPYWHDKIKGDIFFVRFKWFFQVRIVKTIFIITIIVYKTDSTNGVYFILFVITYSWPTFSCFKKRHFFTILKINETMRPTNSCSASRLL